MVCAKRTKKNFDPITVVLPIIFMTLGYTMVTLRSKTLLYINTSYPPPLPSLLLIGGLPLLGGGPVASFVSSSSMSAMSSQCSNETETPSLSETAFHVVEQLREIWLTLNGTLVREKFNPLISEFVQLTYMEFTKPNAFSRPFSV